MPRKSGCVLQVADAPQPVSVKTRKQNVYLTRDDTSVGGQPAKKGFFKSLTSAFKPLHRGDDKSAAAGTALSPLGRTLEDGTPMDKAYLNPVFYRDQPKLWLPRDELGISAEQVLKARAHGVDITDEDATVTPKGKIEIQRDTLPGQSFDP